MHLDTAISSFGLACFIPHTAAPCSSTSHRKTSHPHAGPFDRFFPLTASARSSSLSNRFFHSNPSSLSFYHTRAPFLPCSHLYRTRTILPPSASTPSPARDETLSVDSDVNKRLPLLSSTPPSRVPPSFSIVLPLCLYTGSSSSLSLQNVGIFWILLMIASFFFQAADTVLKEKIFLDSSRRLKGGSVDLFVVNSFGSAFQAMFICLLLPFLSNLWGIPFSMLPTYIKDGGACFLNIGKLASGCEGAPMLPLLFVVVNMAFNISMLHCLKISSAVVSSLASTFSVPLSIYAFTLPLPFIGTPSPLPAGFLLGATVLMAGLLIYTWTPSPPPRPTTTLPPETILPDG